MLHRRSQALIVSLGMPINIVPPRSAAAADMKAEDIVSVQSLVGFSQWLEHESIIRIQGSWETDKAIFIVEEFAVLGDLMQVRGGLSWGT